MAARVAATRCKTCGNDEANSRCSHIDRTKEFVTVHSIEFLERDQIKLNEKLSVASTTTSVPDFVRLQFRDRCSVVDGVLASSINDQIRTAIANAITRRKMTFHNFVSRPWSLSASALSTKEDFAKVFKMKADQFEIQNPESKYVDIVLGKHFQQLHHCNLHYIKGVQLQEWLLPVHATPDALWTFDGVEYVIEFKTVRSLKGMTAEKFAKWLLQTGCNHLPMYENQISVSDAAGPATANALAGVAANTGEGDAVNSTNSNTTNITDPTVPTPPQRYLLVLTTLEAPCTTLVFEIHAAANLHACLAKWHEWFDCTDMNAFKAEYLLRYHAKQCNMNQIIAAYTIEKTKEKEKEKKPVPMHSKPAANTESGAHNKKQSAAAKGNKYGGLMDSDSDSDESGSESDICSGDHASDEA